MFSAFRKASQAARGAIGPSLYSAVAACRSSANSVAKLGPLLILHPQ